MNQLETRGAKETSETAQSNRRTQARREYRRRQFLAWSVCIGGFSLGAAATYTITGMLGLRQFDRRMERLHEEMEALIDDEFPKETTEDQDEVEQAKKNLREAIKEMLQLYDQKGKP